MRLADVEFRIGASAETRICLRTLVLTGMTVLALPLAAADAPPVAQVRPVVDDYFGTKVTDPHRYLENLSDPEIRSRMKSRGRLLEGSA